MSRADEVWKNESMAKHYLEGVRAAIPLAAEQLETMIRLIQKDRPAIESFLDLGCGDGVLGRAIFSVYPDSKGVFVDFSETMLDAAKEKLAGEGRKGDLVLKDYADKSWVDEVGSPASFDIIVSGLSIHHQPDERKKEVYQEIFDLLKPGGIFINMEHVLPASEWVKDIFWEIFIGALHEKHRKSGGQKTKEELYSEFAERQEANILSPMCDQLDWLRDIGFIHVDCYMKFFEQAMFGGVKP